MIVDCHTHVDFSADGSKEAEHLANSEKLDHCIVLARPDFNDTRTNKLVSEHVAKYPGKMTAFAYINPMEDDISVKTLKKLRSSTALKGIVIYNSLFGFHPAHSRAMRLYESAEELAMPVFFDNSNLQDAESVLEFAQPFLLDEIAREFKKLKIIIGGMGVPFVDQTLFMVGKHENVYADLTISYRRVWRIYNIVVSAFEQQVMHKLMFGSGFPNCTAEICMETLLGFNKLIGDTNLPTVPRGDIRDIIERDVLTILGIAEGQG